MHFKTEASFMLDTKTTHKNFKQSGHKKWRSFDLFLGVHIGFNYKRLRVLRRLIMFSHFLSFGASSASTQQMF